MTRFLSQSLIYVSNDCKPLMNLFNAFVFFSLVLFSHNLSHASSRDLSNSHIIIIVTLDSRNDSYQRSFMNLWSWIARQLTNDKWSTRWNTTHSLIIKRIYYGHLKTWRSNIKMCSPPVEEGDVNINAVAHQILTLKTTRQFSFYCTIFCISYNLTLVLRHTQWRN